MNMAPDAARMTFEAIAEKMATAAAYADTGRQFAEIGDARGLAYATRCASAALLEAASLVEEVKPAPRPKPGEAA
ncbi:hypothetical protein [Methylobacterium sp. ID0610]|uniref:hypothetical protein n=1 Tax=Methylobacterium carpenticola TaxID=3344827 RepID=UPI00368EB6E3